jgi:hypothetical protein
MQFKAVSVLALAATASASYGYGNVSYTTEVVTAYTTYCPEATQLTYNGQTYTITEATTLTITNCPCTVSKPVYTTSSVACTTCAAPTSAPAYANTTAPGATYPVSPVYPTGTGSAPVGTTTPSAITGGANKAMAVSGAGLAGLLGLAAFLL